MFVGEMMYCIFYHLRRKSEALVVCQTVEQPTRTIWCSFSPQSATVDLDCSASSLNVLHPYLANLDGLFSFLGRGERFQPDRIPSLLSVGGYRIVLDIFVYRYLSPQ